MHLHLLLLLLPLASSCPGEAWVAAGSSCYLSSSTSMSWWAALEYCELEGGYLVEVGTITSPVQHPHFHKGFEQLYRNSGALLSSLSPQEVEQNRT